MMGKEAANVKNVSSGVIYQPQFVIVIAVAKKDIF